jgi:hypothetical protein
MPDVKEKAPYVFQEYPRTMYHVILGTKSVQNEDELLDALEDGWSKEFIDVGKVQQLRDEITAYKKLIMDKEKELDLLYKEEERKRELTATYNPVPAKKQVEETKESKEQIEVKKHAGRPAGHKAVDDTLAKMGV